MANRVHPVFQVIQAQRDTAETLDRRARRDFRDRAVKLADRDRLVNRVVRGQRERMA